MIERKPTDKRGLFERHRNPTKLLEFGTEYGWLTALKQSAGHGCFTIFRCRCGERVICRHRHVLRSVQDGRVPACPKCRAAAMREAKARRQLRLAAERERRTG